MKILRNQEMNKLVQKSIGLIIFIFTTQFFHSNSLRVNITEIVNKTLNLTDSITFEVTQDHLKSFYQPDLIIQDPILLIIQTTTHLKRFKFVHDYSPILVVGQSEQNFYTRRDFNRANNTLLSYLKTKNGKIDFQNWIQKNNQQSVTLNATAGNYTALLYDTNKPTQDLVTSFEIYLSDQYVCDRSCSGNGLCFYGQCICFYSFLGYDCSRDIRREDQWYIHKVPITQRYFDRQADFFFNIDVSQQLRAQVMFNGMSTISVPNTVYSQSLYVRPGGDDRIFVDFQQIRNYLDYLWLQHLETTDPFFAICFYVKGYVNLNLAVNMRIEDNKRMVADFSNSYGFYMIMCFFLLMVLVPIFFCTIYRNSENDEYRINQHNLAIQAQAAAAAAARDELKKKQNKNALTPEDLNKYLPIFQFTEFSTLYPDLNKEDECCNICLLEFQSEDDLRATICDHFFHSMCLQDWLKVQENCPSCRQPLTREILQQFSLEKESENAVKGPQSLKPKDIQNNNNEGQQKRNQENGNENEEIKSPTNNNKDLQSDSFANTPRTTGNSKFSQAYAPDSQRNLIQNGVKSKGFIINPSKINKNRKSTFFKIKHDQLEDEKDNFEEHQKTDGEHEEIINYQQEEKNGFRKENNEKGKLDFKLKQSHSLYLPNPPEFTSDSKLKGNDHQIEDLQEEMQKDKIESSLQDQNNPRYSLTGSSPPLKLRERIDFNKIQNSNEEFKQKVQLNREQKKENQLHLDLKPIQNTDISLKKKTLIQQAQMLEEQQQRQNEQPKIEAQAKNELVKEEQDQQKNQIQTSQFTNDFCSTNNSLNGSSQFNNNESENAIDSIQQESRAQNNNLESIEMTVSLKGENLSGSGEFKQKKQRKTPKSKHSKIEQILQSSPQNGQEDADTADYSQNQ